MNNMNRRFKLGGLLALSDSPNYEYIVTSEDGKETNLTKILNSIYYSPTITYCSVVNVEVEMNGRYKFREEGYLELREEVSGIYTFHVNSENLDLKLFKNTNKNLNINITHILDKGDKN